jgi:hypothetical protein
MFINFIKNLYIKYFFNKKIAELLFVDKKIFERNFNRYKKIMGHGTILTIEDLNDTLETFKVFPFKIKEDIINKTISIYFDNVKNNQFCFRKKSIYKCINYIKANVPSYINIKFYINDAEVK